VDLVAVLDDAAVPRHLVLDDAEQGGLADAVGADDAHLVAAVDVKGNIFKKGLPIKGF